MMQLIKSIILCVQLKHLEVQKSVAFSLFYAVFHDKFKWKNHEIFVRNSIVKIMTIRRE